MRAVIQRVDNAVVEIDGKTHASIGRGLLILLGVEQTDSKDDANWLAGKIARLRIFDDDNGVMNLSVVETQGEILVVSQFTLHASTKKGNRPSYIRSAAPEHSIPLYEYFVQTLAGESGQQVKTGVFGAMMHVSLVNNGPVTIIIDSQNKE